MTRAAPPSVYQTYEPEKALNDPAGQVAYCARCRAAGRRTVLVHKTNAIGQVRDRCPVCDGVAPPRPLNPNEVLRPQSLIAESQLLPPCPPGVLRCQGCARPVEGDARLCRRCELPALRAPVVRSTPALAPRMALGVTTARVLQLIVSDLDAGAHPTAILIADRIGSTSQNIDQHIQKLERKGYIAIAGTRRKRIFTVLIREPVTTA